VFHLVSNLTSATNPEVQLLLDEQKSAERALAERNQHFEANLVALKKPDDDLLPRQILRSPTATSSQGGKKKNKKQLLLRVGL